MLSGTFSRKHVFGGICSRSAFSRRALSGGKLSSRILVPVSSLRQCALRRMLVGALGRALSVVPSGSSYYSLSEVSYSAFAVLYNLGSAFSATSFLLRGKRCLRSHSEFFLSVLSRQCSAAISALSLLRNASKRSSGRALWESGSPGCF